MYKNYSLLLLSLLFAVLVSCSNEGSNQNNNTGQVLPAVEAVQAQFGGLPLEERLSGVVSAGTQVEIYPRITAPIEEVYAETGQTVEKGEVLVRLRDNEFRERLRQAEASLRINLAQQRQARAALGEIESQLRRQQILEERDLTSELEMERIRAQLESAEASLELAMAQVEQAESNVEEQKDALDQTLIRAPISGTVGLRAAEIGMQATTNSSLFMIGDLSRSKISVNLTERMMRYIMAGQRVRIFSENLGDTVLTGEISRISPFLGAGSFSTEAEIDVGNESRFLMAGMFVNIDVLYGESEQATIIPLSSIYRHPQTGETGVFVAVNFGIEAEMLEDLEGNQLSNPTDVEFIPIEVIARGREAAGVAGIRSGQWVVTVGQNLLIRDQSGIARVRPVTWDKILDMQRMRPQDLLREIMNGETTQGSASNL